MQGPTLARYLAKVPWQGGTLKVPPTPPTLAAKDLQVYYESTINTAPRAYPCAMLCADGAWRKQGAGQSQTLEEGDGPGGEGTEQDRGGDGPGGEARGGGGVWEYSQNGNMPKSLQANERLHISRS
jgi:hypothetical protein